MASIGSNSSPEFRVNQPTRRQAIQTSLCGLGFAATASAYSAQEVDPKEYSFHYDHVIGTSLDVRLVADNPRDAQVAEQAILDEIERLRLVFSTFDPISELSWLNRATGPAPVSADMLEVLHAYEVWQSRSNGAFNGRLGELVRVWQLAEQTGIEPDPAVLARLIERIAEPAWTIDDASGTVTRLGDQPLNLNSIAKGFIIDRAFASAFAKACSLRGLLLNLGGDIRINNGACWLVGVQDPSRPEDNAPPLTAVRLDTAAIATSGGYLRSYIVNGKSRSHLFDPRTGRSADGIASATVVACDNVTANALATTLCVLTPDEGLRLIAATPGTECLFVTASGRQWRSLGFGKLEVPLPRIGSSCLAANAAAAWPDGFQVTIAIDLPKIASPKYRKPYVAVWVEDAKGKPVRSLAVWGNSPKYLRDLFDWWKFAQGNNGLIAAVARATRQPGKYTVVWDGKDDAGTAVEQGIYTVKVEVHREHGKHLIQSGKIRCETAAAKVSLAKNAETEITVVEYGKTK